MIGTNENQHDMETNSPECFCCLVVAFIMHKWKENKFIRSLDFHRSKTIKSRTINERNQKVQTDQLIKIPEVIKKINLLFIDIKISVC